jgi:hypothetical protein
MPPRCSMIRLRRLPAHQNQWDNVENRDWNSMGLRLESLTRMLK